MTQTQIDEIVLDIAKGTMYYLSKHERIKVIVELLAYVNDEPEYPTRVPIDTDNLAEPF